MTDAIASVFEAMGLWVDEEHVSDLIAEYIVELTKQALKEQYEQKHTEVMQEIHRERHKWMLSFRTSGITRAMVMWVKFLSSLKKSNQEKLQHLEHWR